MILFYAARHSSENKSYYTTRRTRGVQTLGSPDAREAMPNASAVASSLTHEPPPPTVASFRTRCASGASVTPRAWWPPCPAAGEGCFVTATNPDACELAYVVAGSSNNI